MDENYVRLLTARTAEINERITTAAKASGRTRGGITLCAADKTRTCEEVAACAELAVDVFGENHVQELIEKYDAGAYCEKPAHVIGHLQTNKAKAAVLRAVLIQSVDSERLISAISKEASKRSKTQDILLEINIGGEESKTGADISLLDRLCDAAMNDANIRLRGLMTIPPVSDTDTARRYFAKMREIFDSYAQKCGREFDTLSMGMTGDFEAAIAEGSTMVRIGTGIFGKRDYGAAK